MKKCVITGIVAFLVGAICGMAFQIEVEIQREPNYGAPDALLRDLDAERVRQGRVS